MLYLSAIFLGIVTWSCDVIVAMRHPYFSKEIILVGRSRTGSSGLAETLVQDVKVSRQSSRFRTSRVQSFCQYEPAEDTPTPCDLFCGHDRETCTVIKLRVTGHYLTSRTRVLGGLYSRSSERGLPVGSPSTAEELCGGRTHGARASYRPHGRDRASRSSVSELGDRERPGRPPATSSGCHPPGERPSYARFSPRLHDGSDVGPEQHPRAC